MSGRCLPGRVRRFSGAMTDAAGERVKVPHMGWNRVRQVAAHPLWRGVPDEARFYFVHSYYVETSAPKLIAGSSDYPRPFTCAIATDNVFAVQFHPEKSGADGLHAVAEFRAAGSRPAGGASAAGRDGRLIRIPGAMRITAACSMMNFNRDPLRLDHRPPRFRSQPLPPAELIRVFVIRHRAAC